MLLLESEPLLEEELLWLPKDQELIEEILSEEDELDQLLLVSLLDESKLDTSNSLENTCAASELKELNEKSESESLVLGDEDESEREDFCKATLYALVPLYSLAFKILSSYRPFLYLCSVNLHKAPVAKALSRKSSVTRIVVVKKGSLEAK